MALGDVCINVDGITHLLAYKLIIHIFIEKHTLKRDYLSNAAKTSGLLDKENNCTWCIKRMIFVADVTVF